MRFVANISGLIIALAVGLSVTSCVDKEKCDEAVRVTRDALQKDQPDLARQWRDRAWKLCNDSATTSALDKEITDKEAAIAKRAADQQAAVGAAAQQRMNTATGIWRAFDKLDPKEQTEAQLDACKAKVDRLSQGLPPEYAKQVNDYDASEYARRQKVVETAKGSAAK